MRRALEWLRTLGRRSTSSSGRSSGRSSGANGSSGANNGSGNHNNNAAGAAAAGVVTHPPNPSLAWPPSGKHSVAYIEEITAISPTVKQVQLRLLCGKSDPPRAPFVFKAGQWVDFYIQGMQRCGGYSMVSAPESLPQLTLAVKASSFSEPAQWVHGTARAMDHVAMKAGGSFFFEMTPDHWRRGTRLVLLGGGVGINPLVSILRHVAAWLEGPEGNETSSTSSGDGGKGEGFRVSLVHCAGTADELLFRPDIEALARQHPAVVDPPLFICTQDPSWQGRTARVDAPLLWSLVPADAAERTLVYVCGPAAMIDDAERIYTKEGGPGGRPALRREQVLFERWW